MSIQTRLRGTRDGSRTEIRLPENIIQNNYRVNVNEIIQKKYDLCDQTVQIENKGGNYCIITNTAVFETIRNILLSHTHLPRPREEERSGEESPKLETTSSRQCKYTVERDLNKLVVKDCLQLYSWNALKRKVVKNQSGSCAVTINMYRTTNQIMINGNPDDAKVFSDYLADLVNKVADVADDRGENQAIKMTILKYQQLQPEQKTKKQKKKEAGAETLMALQESHQNPRVVAATRK
jgi:hypothetical protein